MILYLLWLSQIKGIGPATVKKLLEYFPDPEQIYNASREELMAVEGIGASTASLITKSPSLDNAKKILELVHKNNMKILTCLDPLYPAPLRKIPEMPPLLFYYGKISPSRAGVCIIGARKCTSYGKEVTREAAEFLAKNQVPVISGMAAGIDSYAHTACINAGGYTLAFLGCGVDLCFPKEHLELKEAIMEKGAVISPYIPGTPPYPSNFPKRNYLMAAWCHKLLVVEAGRKSGSLLTASYAMKKKRQVLAVPGSIYSKESQGTNALLANGAEIYLNSGQLLPGPVLTSSKHKNTKVSFTTPLKKETRPKSKRDPFFMPSLSFTRTGSSKLNPTQERIWELLKNTPLTMEQLAVHFSENLPGFFESLSLMELEGILERMPGGKFRLVP